MRTDEGAVDVALLALLFLVKKRVLETVAGNSDAVLLLEVMVSDGVRRFITQLVPTAASNTSSRAVIPESVVS